MFIGVLFIAKLDPWPSKGEWINELWYVHALASNATVKGTRLLIYVTIWVSFHDFVWMERSQAPKNTNCTIPLT